MELLTGWQYPLSLSVCSACIYGHLPSSVIFCCKPQALRCHVGFPVSSLAQLHIDSMPCARFCWVDKLFKKQDPTLQIIICQKRRWAVHCGIIRKPRGTTVPRKLVLRNLRIMRSSDQESLREGGGVWKNSTECESYTKCRTRVLKPVATFSTDGSFAISREE